MERCARVNGRVLAASAMVLACLVIAGCGGGVDLEEIHASDPGKVEDCVSSVQGAAGEPDGKRWERIMLDPDAIGKSQRKVYAAHNFFATYEDVEITGDTATVPVLVGLAATGEEIGTVPWTAEKVGGEWKLKDIPLPEGISAK